MEVGEGVTASAKVTLRYSLSSWHHGAEVNLNDIRYAIAFDFDWAAEDYLATRSTEITSRESWCPCSRPLKGSSLSSRTP